MSFTAADLKLGGRLQAACDAMAANKLRVAAGVFMEIAGDLNTEAESTDGLLAPEEDDWSVMTPAPPAVVTLGDAQSLQMCSRNVHSYGPPDPVTGWATCRICGNVNVTGGSQSGVMDMGKL